jgi:tetratricopeptide (TPR) repeat protein
VDRGAREFAAAMSAGLKAYESGDLVGAKGAFERALSLAPGSVEAADGLARTELALRLEGIREHQAKAADLEREERWSDAAHEYSAALALDPTLRFAREGKDRAVARAALNDQLEYHITHPERLSEDSVLEEARTALASARGIEPTTEKLQVQADRLQGAIKIATTPIRVLLVSDDLTRVVVYRVGRLGTFERRHLDLRPGTYTVVGTREGFRDVRRQLEVVATGENKPMTVRCEEKI